MNRPPPSSTLFPYTTLFRSIEGSCFALLVKTDPGAEPRHRGMSLFIAPKMAGFGIGDRKSTRLNSSHLVISYAVFCLKKKKYKQYQENNDAKHWEYNKPTLS